MDKFGAPRATWKMLLLLFLKGLSMEKRVIDDFSHRFTFIRSTVWEQFAKKKKRGPVSCIQRTGPRNIKFLL